MVAHYFQQDLPAQISQSICSTIDGSEGLQALEMTPARLEQLCAEHDALPELCNTLQTLVKETPEAQANEPFLTRVASVNAEARLNVR